MSYGEPLNFSCINSETDGSGLFYDYQFEVPSESEKDLIVMQVFNFSDHYENLTHMQQERNELEINKEILKLEQEKIAAQNELLEYKNSELKRLQKQKTDFFARVSHEIRNPVNGIAGLIQLINKNYHEYEKAKEYMDALSATSDHLVNIVNNVLDFSKLESSNEEIELEKIEFDCRSLVKSMINAFKFQANEQRISLDSKIGDNVPKKLVGDKYKLTQVITNLIGNAIKFTHEGGIMLLISVEGDVGEEVQVQFKLRDTGIGMPEDVIEHIFEPYKQADQSVKRLYGGTGLGLPIVKNLIELMNGSISVSSKVGEGSTFTFVVPFDNVSKEKDSLSNQETALYFSGRVLLGEDDLINQKVMEGLFESEEINCDVAGDGDEVLKLFELNSYELIVLDIDMPIVDGIEAARKIRQTSETPIIINSGKPYSEFKTKVAGITNIEYLQKPITQSSFKNIINKVYLSLLL
ncbi:MAG: ATP-binding protein [Bacteroidota bacterium]